MELEVFQLKVIDMMCIFYIIDSKINFRTYAYFSEKQNMPLLGRYGFFDMFKNVSFNQDRGSFTLIK
mgnify:CR=1 FL=1